MVMMHVCFFWDKGALRRNCRQIHSKTSFFFLGFSVESEFSGKFLGFTPVASLDWEGGGWLTHGDFALEAAVDFLAVVVSLRGAPVALPSFATSQF